jgi:hypothetical protein
MHNVPERVKSFLYECVQFVSEEPEGVVVLSVRFKGWVG